MKSPQAFRSIGEVARLVGVATHVLRYWETQFPALAPVRRPDGRRYYRPDDLLLAAGLCEVMREDGLTIRGAQRLIARDKGAELRERGRLRLEAAERRTAEEKDTPRRKPASSPRARRAADQAEDAASETGDTRVSGPAPVALDAHPSGGARPVQREGLRDPDAARTVRNTGERHAGDHARAPLAGPCVEIAHGLREEPGAKAAPAGLAADGVTPLQAAHGAPGLPDPRAGEYGRGFPGQSAADAGQAWADLPSGALEGPTHGQAIDGGRSAPDGPSCPPVPGQGTGAWLGRLAATAAALRARRQPLPPDAGTLHDALRRMQDDG